MHDGRHFARVIVRHHVRQPYHFLFHFIHGRSHRDHIARAQLAFVFDALLYTRNPAFLLPHPRTRQSHRGKHLPARLVKFPHVPHHVHMPHMVTMLCLYDSAIRDRTLSLGHAKLLRTSMDPNQKCLRVGAQERTRTSTPLRELAPEASASANSATWAFPAAGTTIHIAVHSDVCQRRRIQQTCPKKFPARLVEQSECVLRRKSWSEKRKGAIARPFSSVAKVTAASFSPFYRQKPATASRARSGPWFASRLPSSVSLTAARPAHR